MGVFDLLRPSSETTQHAASALEAARDNQPDDGAIGRMVQVLMDTGLDGRGPLKPATTVADRALRRTRGEREAAIERVRRSHVAGGAVGGFVTGIGGVVTQALPPPPKRPGVFPPAAPPGGGGPPLPRDDTPRPPG